LIRNVVSALCVVITLSLAGCGNNESSVAGSQDQPSNNSAADPGKKIYGEYCFSCHGPGLNGAPKLGDVEGWAPRVAKGTELMLQATIEGIPPAMPPRGQCRKCSDEELRAAVIYMSGE